MITREKSGSFRALRERDLSLFNEALRRHDRGWPHPAKENPKATPARRPWTTVGIFHFRHDEERDS